MSREMREQIERMKNLDNSLNENLNKEEKYFMVTDKSGRSMKPWKLDKTHIEKNWDLSEEDWNTEQTLKDFLEDCYIGDTWETQSEKMKCVAIK